MHISGKTAIAVSFLWASLISDLIFSILYSQSATLIFGVMAAALIYPSFNLPSLSIYVFSSNIKIISDWVFIYNKGHKKSLLIILSINKCYTVFLLFRLIAPCQCWYHAYNNHKANNLAVSFFFIPSSNIKRPPLIHKSIMNQWRFYYTLNVLIQLRLH